ncbi:hypothetical protein KAI04_04080 [Candidatus Pacearchaeota archaeon]|nr:hypothetical protein [Candidatus Pacearchaeota archaeon]
MTEYWYKALISEMTKYVLLDNSGDIRASAPDIDGIILARQYYEWGKVHKCTFNGKTLKIGKEIK